MPEPRSAAFPPPPDASPWRLVLPAVAIAAALAAGGALVYVGVLIRATHATCTSVC